MKYFLVVIQFFSIYSYAGITVPDPKVSYFCQDLISLQSTSPYVLGYEITAENDNGTRDLNILLGHSTHTNACQYYIVDESIICGIAEFQPDSSHATYKAYKNVTVSLNLT